VNAFSELRQAGIGWLDMIAGRPGGAEKFNASRAGLINATGCYFFLVVLTMVALSLLEGFPGLDQALIGLLVNALPLLGVWAVIWATVRFITPELPVLTLMVPATYAMAFILLAGLPLSLFAGNSLANALLGALGYMLYRAARDVAKLSIGLSIAFELLCIVVLVALPIGLYMLTSGGQGPTSG